MSTSSSHAYTAALVFLLAAFSHVQCWNRKTSNNQRESLLYPREDHAEEVNYHDNVKLRHHQHWPKHKTEDLEKLPQYGDKEAKPHDTKKVSDKDTVFSTNGKENGKKEVQLEIHSDNKFVKDNNQEDVSDNSHAKSKNTVHVSISKQHKLADTDSAVAADLERTNELLSEIGENGDSSSSNNSSSLTDSSSGFKNSSADSVQESACSTCRMREIDKQYRIMHFKQQILNTLQMRTIPNTTGVPIPKVPAVVHLYGLDDEMMNDSPQGRRTGGHGHRFQDVEYEEDFIVKTERVFTTAKTAPVARHLNLTDTIYFLPSVQLFSSKIKTAYLWFYIRKQDVPPSLITVERILPESLPGNKVAKKTVFSQKLTKDKAFGWKRIDMRDTLRQWIRHPVSNLGLQMRAEDSSGVNLIVLPPSQDSDKGYEPWLDTKIIEPRSNSRRRRSESLLCVENSTDSRCCRHPLLVGFAEFGWDWIIAPTHVKADYCTGECRFTMQDNTPYSWVNQQMSGSNSCCTPTKLSPLPLLYFDESMNIVYQILQNMKVDKCGCA